MKISRNIEEIREIVGNLRNHKDEITDSLERCEREFQDVEHLKIGGLIEKLNFDQLISEIKEKPVAFLEEVIDRIDSNNDTFEEVDEEIRRNVK